MMKRIIIQLYRHDRVECRKFKIRQRQFYQYPKDLHSFAYRRVTRKLNYGIGCDTNKKKKLNRKNAQSTMLQIVPKNKKHLLITQFVSLFTAIYFEWKELLIALCRWFDSWARWNCENRSPKYPFSSQQNWFLTFKC